jgi:UDP-N-acetylmuramyl pentapeptide phosphotransferase/UDP-N-acetylglucosamine-1-phosphate transferase
MRHGADMIFVLVFAAFVLVAGATTALFCWLLRPLLVRYALARPNARSSHKEPTPQGGGIAVLIGMVTALGFIEWLFPGRWYQEAFIVMLAAIFLGFVGAWDDIRPLSPVIRLLLQAVGVSAVIFSLPPLDLPFLPPQLERPFALLAGLWFVNLTNFMDGLDGITVAGFVPIAAFVIFHEPRPFPEATFLIALAFLGALLGFAPFNKPVARLFLGDVGALSIGLIGAYLLYRIAGAVGLIPALILPLYHVCDATLTLFRRLLKGERIWEAHRTHAYQKATDNGFSVLSISAHVLALNIILCGLAFAALRTPALNVQLACLAAGFALTLLLIGRFTRRRDAA